MNQATLAPPSTGSLRRRKFTTAEFWKMDSQGLFAGQRVILIGGEILEMPPQGNLHALGTQNVYDALVPVFGPNYWVRSQMTLDLRPNSLPDPDIAVVAGNKRSFHGQNQNPTTAVLIVEVSFATLSDDRHLMASLYASAGIADYWILNISDAQLEVYRDPIPDAAEPFGHRYANITILRTGDSISPLAVPNASIAIADLLPV